MFKMYTQPHLIKFPKYCFLRPLEKKKKKERKKTKQKRFFAKAQCD